jgi:hypothetical protein
VAAGGHAGAPRVLATAATHVDLSVLQDALSRHLLPLPGSRVRWLPTVRALRDWDPAAAAATGAGAEAATLEDALPGGLRKGQVLRLVHEGEGLSWSGQPSPPPPPPPTAAADEGQQQGGERQQQQKEGELPAGAGGALGADGGAGSEDDAGAVAGGGGGGGAQQREPPPPAIVNVMASAAGRRPPPPPARMMWLVQRGGSEVGLVPQNATSVLGLSALSGLGLPPRRRGPGSPSPSPSPTTTTPTPTGGGGEGEGEGEGGGAPEGGGQRRQQLALRPAQRSRDQATRVLRQFLEHVERTSTHVAEEFR